MTELISLESIPGLLISLKFGLWLGQPEKRQEMRVLFSVLVVREGIGLVAWVKYTELDHQNLIRLHAHSCTEAEFMNEKFH
jgi:hypothetical protein